MKLNQEDLPLFNALAEAHAKAAERDSNSTVAFKNCIYSGLSDSTAPASYVLNIEHHLLIKQAVVSAAFTLDTLHAPISKIRYRLFSGRTLELARALLAGKKSRRTNKIYGWGSSFVKGEFDPILDGVNLMLALPRYTKELMIISEIQENLIDAEISIYPNIGLYTAILAEHMDFPKGFEFLLVLLLRSRGFEKLYCEAEEYFKERGNLSSKI